VIDFHWTEGAIVGVPSHACDLFYQRYAGVVALSENGVIAIQHLALTTEQSLFRDKELRTVRIWPRIRISQPPWPIKLHGRRGFVLEGISRVTHTCSRRIATLNHELGDHAMKNGPVI